MSKAKQVEEMTKDELSAALDGGPVLAPGTDLGAALDEELGPVAPTVTINLTAEEISDLQSRLSSYEAEVPKLIDELVETQAKLKAQDELEQELAKLKDQLAFQQAALEGDELDAAELAEENRMLKLALKGAAAESSAGPGSLQEALISIADSCTIIDTDIGLGDKIEIGPFAFAEVIGFKHDHSYLLSNIADRLRASIARCCTKEHWLEDRDGISNAPGRFDPTSRLVLAVGVVPGRES